MVKEVKESKTVKPLNETNVSQKVKNSKIRTVKKIQLKPGKLSTPFRAIGRYLKGAWRELRLVRWPNRKTTWGMTAAVLIFSVALGLIIFLLDFVFTYLFKEVIL